MALALRLPSVLDFESLLHLDTIKTVKDHPLLSLLNIFVRGSFADFQGWMAPNEGVLPQFS